MNSTPLLIAVLLLVPMSRAEDSTGTEAKELEDAVAAASLPEFHPPKSVKTAYKRAIGISLIPGFGWVIGPSMGQYYADANGPGTLGLLIRLAGFNMFAMGALGAAFEASGEDPSGRTRGLLYGGLGLYAAGAAYSFWDTPRAVHRANEKARKEHESRTSFSPILHSASDGRLMPGIAARVTF